MTRLRMLRFTKYYKDTIQGRLTILISFCSKFIGVYVCQKLSKKTFVWQSYCKNKMVQFFDSLCRRLSPNPRELGGTKLPLFPKNSQRKYVESSNLYSSYAPNVYQRLTQTFRTPLHTVCSLIIVTLSCRYIQAYIMMIIPIWHVKKTAWLSTGRIRVTMLHSFD